MSSVSSRRAFIRTLTIGGMGLTPDVGQLGDQADRVAVTECDAVQGVKMTSTSPQSTIRW
jgi:hypothetical protein